MRVARVMDEKGTVTYAIQDKGGTLLRAEGDLFSGTLRATTEQIAPTGWLPPIDPPVVLCIGLNYAKHAAEGGSPIPKYPVLFMKNPRAVTGHLQPICIPKVCDDEVDYEAELVVILKKSGRDIPKEKALEYVLGYTAGNDVSARRWQSERGGSQWNRGKSFDTFAPMGPFLVTADEIPNPNTLGIRSELNGKEMQRSNTSDMIFDVPTLIAFLSQDTTLIAGTAIMTGTPEGVGWTRNPKITLKPGDQISVEVEQIGVLTNPVIAAP
ncbi:MAG TPA: fumarylacetoacetate hydrolase family protein [Candidatus Hydrogenedentes bacterium]|nr:fumarylacetoacetate hydrolase family protein [Candidatus Hydrogenedentota bacterium]HOL77177.1 fumarylacetoacetate hydrolase family protein [Candidatus Hydrogenedentota bacterium]HPO85884.1 fumarylacetoacetate hydrolase family protein [Candidatus Hydrogenedentota bacterium]